VIYIEWGKIRVERRFGGFDGADSCPGKNKVKKPTLAQPARMGHPNSF
jgi:hypothetical protein